MNRVLSPLATLLILTACGGPAVTGPSLLPRAVEGRSNAEPVRPVPTATADAALDMQIAERRRAFSDAANGFERAVGAGRGAIMRGRAAREGSDAWVAGQVALGEVSQARAAVESSVVALEELAIARDSERLPPYPALEAALADAATRMQGIAAIDAELRPAS